MNELVTESKSNYDNLEKMPLSDLMEAINNEDAKVHEAVKTQIPKITQLVSQIVPRFEKGGRLFYIGAGTSGRLGILDASEIPPTYGLPTDRVVGLIAGGDRAIRKGIEFAEDNTAAVKSDLDSHQLNKLDTVVGIAASGTTPYVIAGINHGREIGCLTGCVTNNPNSKLGQASDVAIEAVVGPEFVTGSTRMKSGTAQKLILNMISTTLMIKIGRVQGHKMVNMQLSNNKLLSRGTKFLMEELAIDEALAAKLLKEHGSVKNAMAASNSTD